MGAALCGQRSGAQHLDDFAARTAAAWRRRSAAEGSLSRSRVARHGFMYVIVQTTLGLRSHHPAFLFLTAPPFTLCRRAFFCAKLKLRSRERVAC